MGGLFQSDVAKERMDGGEAGIARACAIASFLFEMIEELADEGRIGSSRRNVEGGVPSRSAAYRSSRRKVSR